MPSKGLLESIVGCASSGISVVMFVIWALIIGVLLETGIEPLPACILGYFITIIGVPLLFVLVIKQFIK